MITQSIFERARKEPQRVAFIENDVPLTYAAFAGRIGTVRRHLESLRLPTDGFAGVLAASFLEQWVVTLALRSLGINTFSISDVKMLNELKIRNVGLIAVSQALAQDFSRTPPEGGARVVSIPQGLFDPGGVDEALPDAIGAPAEGGFLIWSSGTTGVHKKVFHTGSAYETYTAWAIEAFAYDRNTIYQALNFPLWTGLGGGLVPPVWAAGGCVVTHWKDNPFAAYFRHQPTLGMLAPVMLPLLLAATPETSPLQKNFVLQSGGGFLPLAVAKELVRRVTPHVQVIYGSSETASILRSQFKNPDDLHWLTEHVSRYEIADETGNVCPAGIEGEIRVPLQDFDCHGYLDDEEASTKFFRDGCFYPGDMGVRREDGRIRVLGRVDDVLNMGGWKIAVGPIEDAIARSVGSRSVCLFREQDARGNEEVLVAIELDRLPSEQEIKTVLAGRPGFDRFRIAVLKSFPRTQGGMTKVDRLALKKMLD